MAIRVQTYNTGPRRIQMGGIDPGTPRGGIRDVSGTASDNLLKEALAAGKELTGIAIQEYVKDETTRVSQSLLGMQQELNTERDRYMAENKGQDALGAGQHFEQFAKKTARKYLQEGKFSGRFAEMFMKQASGTALHFTEQGQAYGRQQKSAWEESVLQGDMEEFRKLVAQNYDNQELIEFNRDALRQRIEGMRPGMDNRALFSRLDSQTAGSIIEGYLAHDDISGARGALDKYRDLLGGEVNRVEASIASHARALESRARARQAEARLDISARIQDSMAAWGQGQEAPTAPTRAEVMAAYGEKGEAVWREVEAGRQYGADMQAIGTMTSEQQRQLLEERKPVPGEGYADAMKRYALLEEAVQKDNELRQEDPGAYLVLRDAGVKFALDAFSKASTPENAQAYARAVRAGMEARGMEFDAGTPLLPKSQAEALAGSIVRSEDPAGQLSGLQQTFGKDWPAVERQIVQGNKLPSAMRVMAGGMETEDGRLLMDSYRNKDFTKQSEASLNVKEADVRVTVRGKLEDMLATVRAQGDLSMDAALVDSATRLTLTYMQRGDDMDDAVSKAVQAVGGDRYSYRDSYRIPVTLDADKVAYGARRALRDVALGDTLTTPRAVSLPQGYVDESFAATVRREGTWVTMPDESGLQLFVLGRPVMDKDGKPIVKTWDELTAVGGDAPSGYENFQDWQRAWEEE
ncbi:hypothetical protein [Desulfovibrio piger]|uniref:hypothetical protein n=1 Tax=Desulfovibrio piger TaxID=901 RepID=UPI002430B678|nr:hypothetical protein [Desulfovibrio piger]MCI6941036.1 hypothetical protein [Desulfovibrio piger]